MRDPCETHARSMRALCEMRTLALTPTPTSTLTPTPALSRCKLCLCAAPRGVAKKPAAAAPAAAAAAPAARRRKSSLPTLARDDKRYDDDDDVACSCGRVDTSPSWARASFLRGVERYYCEACWDEYLGLGAWAEAGTEVAEVEAAEAVTVMAEVEAAAVSSEEEEAVAEAGGWVDVQGELNELLGRVVE